MEAFHSALSFASTPQLRDLMVTRAEYQEAGNSACRRKFKDWKSDDKGKEKEKGAPSVGKGKARQRDDDEGTKKGGRAKTRVSSMRRR